MGMDVAGVDPGSRYYAWAIAKDGIISAVGWQPLWRLNFGASPVDGCALFIEGQSYYGVSTPKDLIALARVTGSLMRYASNAQILLPITHKGNVSRESLPALCEKRLLDTELRVLERYFGGALVPTKYDVMHGIQLGKLHKLDKDQRNDVWHAAWLCLYGLNRTKGKVQR